jgi:hypothetical protein
MITMPSVTVDRMNPKPGERENTSISNVVNTTLHEKSE